MSLREHPYQFHLLSNGLGGDIHAFGAKEKLIDSEIDGAWSKARDFLDEQKGKFVFASFAYELKDDIEDLSSDNPCSIEFPSLVLVVPRVVFVWEKGEIDILQINDSSVDLTQLEQDIRSLHSENDHTISQGTFHSIPADEYVQKVVEIQEHIQRGDIYELNYCQEFRAEGVFLDPWSSFMSLNQRTKAPYSCHIRLGDLHILCASPELFIEKEGTTVRSKPIKGTRKRSSDPLEDQNLITELQNDLKERAENIMITDLVRNDLSKFALSGSVQVEELCAIHSYKTVHQMISTITGEVDQVTHPIDIIRSCFPMGSMTGAPKIRAMELIEEYESFRRGIYSGSIGLFTPNWDFTMNVVIRSILYDAKSQKASVAAGGAITALSNPRSEYEESLLKARAMLSILGLDI